MSDISQDYNNTGCVKKYKLIKEYPGHELGDIAVVDEKTFCYWQNNRSPIYAPFLPGTNNWFAEISDSIILPVDSDNFDNYCNTDDLDGYYDGYMD